MTVAFFLGCGSAPKRAEPAPTAKPSGPQPATTKSESLPDLISQIKAAYQAGDYNRGLALVTKVLESKTADVSTYDRLGSVYFALGRYGDALSMWGQALPLEKDLRQRRRLREAIVATRASLGLPDEPLTQAGLAPAPKKRAPTVEESLKPKAKVAKTDAKQSRELYKDGVKHYAEGEYLEATTLFEQALELDPSNDDAKKALERLRLGS